MEFSKLGKIKEMISPPVPKEVSVSVADSVAGVILIITCESQDAKLFVDTLDRFGTFMVSPLRNSVNLIVSNTFDWQEVARYIESYNEKD